MAVDGGDEAGVLDAKQPDAADVDGVCAIIQAHAVEEEQAILHQDRRVGHVAREDAILVVNETHAIDGEVEGFGAYAGAVAVARVGTLQGEVAYSGVVAVDDQQRLVVADLVSEHDLVRRAHALDGQVMREDHGAVGVGAWGYLHRVAVIGGGDGGGRGFVAKAFADA